MAHILHLPMFESQYVDVITEDCFCLLRLEQVGRNAVVLHFQKHRVSPTASVLNQEEILTEEVLPL